MVGSTDAHTGLAAVEEDNFFGKTSSSEPSARPRRRTRSSRRGDLVIMGWETTASGYAAVWATENTREAIFDAMAAPRDLCHDRPADARPPLRRLRFRRRRRQHPEPGHRRLHQGRADGRRPRTAAPDGKAPTFLVAALKDPIGANLDRYQIVKGWLDAAGEVHETGL